MESDSVERGELIAALRGVMTVAAIDSSAEMSRIQGLKG